MQRAESHTAWVRHLADGHVAVPVPRRPQSSTPTCEGALAPHNRDTRLTTPYVSSRSFGPLASQGSGPSARAQKLRRAPGRSCPPAVSCGTHDGGGGGGGSAAGVARVASAETGRGGLQILKAWHGSPVHVGADTIIYGVLTLDHRCLRAPPAAGHRSALHSTVAATIGEPNTLPRWLPSAVGPFSTAPPPHATPPHAATHPHAATPAKPVRPVATTARLPTQPATHLDAHVHGAPRQVQRCGHLVPPQLPPARVLPESLLHVVRPPVVEVKEVGAHVAAAPVHVVALAHRAGVGRGGAAAGQGRAGQSCGESGHSEWHACRGLKGDGKVGTAAAKG